MINSACLLNAVLILTVATQRTSTIYLNQSVQSLSAVKCWQQTFYHNTLNALQLFATSTQQNPAGELVSKDFPIKNIFNVLSPKLRTHVLLFCLLLHLQQFSISLKWFLVVNLWALFKELLGTFQLFLVSPLVFITPLMGLRPSQSIGYSKA